MRSWHVIREGAAVTVTRQRPVRWDLAVETVLPDAGRLRIAHQVRQDLWRALQRQAGFSPAVEVTRREGALHVRAGGRLAGRFPRQHLEGLAKSVLEQPENRARWLRFARNRGQVVKHERILQAEEGGL